MKLLCPQCGAAIPPASTNLAQGIATCPACQEFFRIDAMLQEDARVARIEKPASSTVEFAVDRDTLGLIVPRGRGRQTAWLFVVFALFWNAVTWTIGVTALRQGQVAPVLFMTLFAAVGMFMLVAALFQIFGEFTLSIDRTECRAIWSLFRWMRTKRIPTNAITAVVQEVVYTRNHQPVYGIALKHGNRTLKFGSALTEDERKWIIGEIRHFLGLRG
jgi:hypothetical protein